MPSLTSELFVRLLDGVTKPAAGIARSIRGIGNAQDDVNRRSPIGQKMAQAMEQNNRRVDELRGRMVDAVAVGYTLQKALSAPIQSAIEFESSMADVRKVVDFPTPKAFEDMKNQIIQMSREIPMTANGLAEIVAAAGQAGIEGDELTKFAEGAAKVGVAIDMKAGDVGEALAKMRAALGYSNEQVFLLADAFNHLSNAQASAAPDILDVVRRVGAQSKMFGFTAEQTAAFASAMLSAGAESEVAATSFRNMGLALTKGASATKAQRGAYAELGLDAKKVAKSMQKDAVGTTREVLKRLAKLPAHMRATVSSDLFGNEARALGPLLTNLGLLESSLALVKDQSLYAGSAQKEFEVRAATTANAVQLFKNNLNALGITIGNALIPAMNEVMTALAPAITAISDFAAANPELTKNVILATTAVIGLRVALIGVQFAAAFMKGGILSIVSPLVKLSEGAVTAARSAIALQTALSGGAAYSGLAKMGTALRGIALAVPGVSAVSGAIAAIGGVLTGPVILAIGAFAAAGAVIYKYWDRISSVLSGVGRAISETVSPAIEAAKPYFEWLQPVGEAIANGWNKAKDALSSFGEWLGTFFSQEVLNDEQKAQWETAGHDAAIAMIEAIKSAFLGLIEWAAGLGSQIGAAIASGASSAVGKIKSMFTWGGSENDAPAPGNDNSPPPTGALPALAKGGPVKKGNHYVVGDGGEPEVFSPGKSGYITPFSKIRPMNDQNMPRGGGGQKQAAKIDYRPTFTIGSVSGVDDLDERLADFERRSRQNFEELIAGTFSDEGAA